MTLEEAKAYLDRMEKSRDKDEACNTYTYAQARDLSAWVSIAEYGNKEAKRRALKVIKSI